MVLMLDKFPKARRHALVVARDPSLESIAALRGSPVHLELLEHMRAVGSRWAAEQAAADASLPAFKFGFHSIPSMRQLHLHVISQDFDSPALKNKKHWLSFTSPFFMALDDAVAQLSAAGPHGGLALDPPAAEALLSGPLRCHGCDAVMPTMPALKSHITACAGVRQRFKLQQ